MHETAPTRRRNDASRWMYCWSVAFLLCLAPWARGQTAGDIRTAVVAAVQADPPQNAAELFTAARLLLDVGEVSLASEYLRRVNGLSLSPADMTKLHDQLGSAALLRLAIDRRVRAESQPLVDRIFAAVRDRLRAPEQLPQRVREVALGSRDESLRALDALRGAAGWGTAAVLRAQWRGVAEDTAAAGRLSAALLDLAAGSPAPLVAAAQQGDLRLQELAWRGLAEVDIDRSELLPALSVAYRFDTPAEIRQLAEQTAQRAFGELPPQQQWLEWVRAAAREEYDGARTAVDPVTVWYWDEHRQAAEPKEFSPAAGAYIRGVQRAAALIQVDPVHEDHHELYLAGVLGALQWASGWQGPWSEGHESQFVKAAPITRVQRVLSLSLTHRWVAAATSACRLLGRAGADHLLADQSPLALALRDPEPRIRNAALLAAIDIDPTATTAVTPVLWREALRTAAAEGRRRAVVMDPHRRRGDQLASLFRETNWTADAFRTVPPAMRLLRESPDIEIILIHSDYRRPPWSEVWQQLRFDGLTRDIPTVVLYESASPEFDVDAQIAADAVFFPVPVNAETLQALRRQLLRVAGIPRLSAAERLLPARRAAEWIQRVRRSPDRYRWYRGVGDVPPDPTEPLPTVSSPPAAP